MASGTSTSGGYSDWLRQRGSSTGEPARKPRRRKNPAAHSAPSGAKPRTKLSYKDQRELDSLPKEIEALEREQADLTARMSTPDYHRQDGQQLRTDSKRLEEIEELLLTRFARWEALGRGFNCLRKVPDPSWGAANVSAATDNRRMRSLRRSRASEKIPGTKRRPAVSEYGADPAKARQGFTCLR